MNYLFFFICLLVALNASAQESETFRLYDLGREGVLLQTGWRFQPGDNPDYARPNFDDRNWPTVDPTQPIQQFTRLQQAGIGWLRLRLKPSPQYNTTTLLQVNQVVASEIYLNGRLLQRYGVIGPTPQTSRAYQPSGEPIGFPLTANTESVLAVRVAYCPLLSPHFPAPLSYSVFSARLSQPVQVVHFYRNRTILVCINLIPSALLLILGVIHFTFFYYNRKQLTNLYFASYTILFSIGYAIGALPFLFRWVAVQEWLFIVGFILSVVGFWFSVVAHYLLFSFRQGRFFYAITAAGLLSIFMANAPDNPLKWLGGPFIWVLFSLELLRVTIVALRRQRPGAPIVVAGHALKALFLVLFINVYYLPLPTGVNPSTIGSLFFSLSALSVPLALSLFLAREFAMISQLLAVKLTEVETLSTQAIAQEQEKQGWLASQNETLEREVKTRTAELQQSLNQLKTTQDQLVQQEKLASLGELTAGVAHEIQNPLNFVNNFSEVNIELTDELRQALHQPAPDLGLADSLLDDLRENMQHISRNGQRAAGIVRSMLEHNRSASAVHERQPTNLNTLADECLTLAYHTMRARNPTLTVELIKVLDPAIGTPELVPQDIGRVLINLFNNAFYAVDQQVRRLGSAYHPQIRITTMTQNGHVLLTVRDNGVGIPADQLKKIYQPFFTTKPTGEGTGLGLSISYDIVTKGHGGQMTVASDVGKYTEFTLQLPITS
ncbi:hypothetical protein DYU11_12730 [Fibrisoma montanum]|uniref:histidine kinase n=1 Tax=Fibrisoma montanum TaxID=2305895 RepID=A0A418MBS7_9BACT|nr:ATP-binding protein [Fibrisoma montanum]RIV23825.1 hypothetical protein DYU11_12730 [Fibrisoma montanum]